MMSCGFCRLPYGYLTFFLPVFGSFPFPNFLIRSLAPPLFVAPQIPCPTHDPILLTWFLQSPQVLYSHLKIWRNCDVYLPGSRLAHDQSQRRAVEASPNGSKGCTLPHLRLRVHCGREVGKTESQKIREFAVKLHLLIISGVVHAKSHQHDFLNTR